MKGFSERTPTPEKVRWQCEAAALTLMNLRGTPAARAERRLAAISPEAYIQAAGLLKHVCKMTGETPGALCERLGIRGVHRTKLIPYGTGRFRLTKEQVRDSYRERDTRRGGSKDNDDEYWANRTRYLTEAEWRVKDRAFDKRIKAMRMASGPPNPARKIQQYADPLRRKQKGA